MSTAELREGELAFDFSKAVDSEIFDRRDRPYPQGWKRVDFVIEEPDRRLLIEVKDPAASAVAEERREEYLRRLHGDTLVAEVLVPKGRDSYCFLHLMEQDDKPLDYLVLIGSGERPLDPALLLALADRLRRRLKHEAEEPWAREYIREVAVLDERQWLDHLSRYPLRRDR